MTTHRTNTDTVLPFQTPIKGKNGQKMNEIHVPAHTMIYVGIAAINRSHALWGDDAHEWKPERWLSPLPDAVSEARIPGVYSNL